MKQYRIPEEEAVNLALEYAKSNARLSEEELHQWMTNFTQKYNSFMEMIERYNSTSPERSKSAPRE